MFDVDVARDAPIPAVLEAHGRELRERVRPLKELDSLHLARADLLLWCPYLVTNDDPFRKQARRAGICTGLQMIGAVDAERLLKIRAGEQPPIDFATGPGVAERMPWVVPTHSPT